MNQLGWILSYILTLFCRNQNGDLNLGSKQDFLVQTEVFVGFAFFGGGSGWRFFHNPDLE